MKVKDIMNSKVLSVSADDKVSEVADMLIKNKIHGVPVVDENKKIIGIITETNFFAKVDGDFYLSQFVKNIQENKLPDVEGLTKESKITQETRVYDIMTKDCVFVDPEMETNELFEVFRKHGFHTIPVAKEDGILCGIVSIADIIKMTTENKK